MNDIIVALELQCLQNLNRKPPNEPDGHTLEVVGLDELVEVHAEELEGNQQVAPEDLIVNYLNDVVVVVLVPVLQVLKNLEFNTGLVLKTFFVSNDFDGNHLLLFVVKALKRLPKTTATYLIKHLVPVS